MSMKRILSGKEVFFSLAGMALFVWFMASGGFDSKSQENQLVTPEEVIKAKDIKNIADAQRFIVGTWVYSQPITDDSLLEWMRWEIKPDGVLIEQTASPRDNQWGAKEIQHYEVFTDKYSDSGDRFYGIRVKGTALSGAIRSDGRLFVKIARTPYSGSFVRGDKSLN